MYVNVTSMLYFMVHLRYVLSNIVTQYGQVWGGETGVGRREGGLVHDIDF